MPEVAMPATIRCAIRPTAPGRAGPAPSAPATASATAAAFILNMRFISILLLWCSGLVRKGPEPELLLADRPEAREPQRLHDQEEDDERSEDHELDVRDHRG